MTEKVHNQETMNERPRVQYVEYVEEDAIDLGEYYRVLRANFWKIAGISLGVGILTLLYMFTKPNLYRAGAVIMPVEEESRQNTAIGALASFGLSVGGPSKVEDLEVLFKSDDLAVRVFTRHDHWKTLLGDRYDPATGTTKPGRLASLFGGKGEPKPPGDWTAIRSARNAMGVSLNRKTGSLTLSFETTSPEESAAILAQYLDEAKNRLQEEALGRANKNKTFIQKQISRTVDALTRDRLYALYGQEVEREMMARNREQFGFRVIDSPRVPDLKSRPHRGRTAVLATILAFVFLAVACIGLHKRESSESKESREKASA